MDATIFDSVVLGPEADRIRQAMSTDALNHLAAALANFVLISDRPVAELADRLLCGFFDAYIGGNQARLTALLVDVLTDDDDLRTIN